MHHHQASGRGTEMHQTAITARSLGIGSETVPRLETSTHNKMKDKRHVPVMGWLLDSQALPTLPALVPSASWAQAFNVPFFGVLVFELGTVPLPIPKLLAVMALIA